jgi:hypothetical protein
MSLIVKGFLTHPVVIIYYYDMPPYVYTTYNKRVASAAHGAPLDLDPV